MKAQQDRADNAMLRADNDNLRNENYRLQNALRSIICTSCGGPGMSMDEQEVRMENIRLKRELEHYSSLLAMPYGGRPIQVPGQGPPPSSLMPSNLDLDMNMYPRAYDQEGMPNCIDMVQLNPLLGPEDTDFSPTNGLIIMDEEKSLALELAVSYMEEVVKKCRVGEPLWIPVNDARKEVMCEKEYAKMFPWPMTRKNDQDGLRCEATRDSMLVIMNSITLVDAFLDADKWIELFPSIISRGKTLQVISSGVNGHLNGSLQLMNAELQMLSPLVPTREIYFLRYCEQIADEGSWVVVDFPLDSFHETYQPSLPRYRRRPSGCVIQDMPNGYSRVTWVEHAEVEDEPLHRIFNDFVSSGIGFGANRWLAVLQRQCERLASLMARNISDLGVIPSPEARKNVMNLAQRMIRMFCVNISSSFGQSWTALSDDSVDDTVRITTRKVTVPGQPNGLILSAVSTTWLPYPHYRVFNLLRDRCQLDVLSNGNPLQEVAHIANGSHHGNCTSLLRVNVASNSSQNVELILQESCTDESSSIVAYSTVDVDAIKLAMNGEDPSCIPLLPLGFVIVPLGNSNDCDDGSPNEGCLLTIGLQDVVSVDPAAKLNLSSVTSINNRINNTLHQITATLAVSGNAGGSVNSGNHCGEGGPLDPSEPKKEIISGTP